MKKIVVRNIPKNIPSLHNDPLLHNIYASRGIVNALELRNDLEYLLPFDQLKGLEKAVPLLSLALQDNWRVVVVGDFDTDGATSTTLIILVLRTLGLKNISYVIPNRFTHGYGLTTDLVMLSAKNHPKLIITVDNGISSIEAVDLANSLNIKVLITDHHLQGNELPNARAVINPNQKLDNFGSKALAGVGVVFYLMLALRSHLRQIGWFKTKGLPELNMVQYLDLVALGTIADVMALDRNNRILVANGIDRIRAGKCRPGILAILKNAKRDYRKITSYDLGFVLAPRLNAAGRLDDMSLGVEILLADDYHAVYGMAQKLNALNDERREIEDKMLTHALKKLDELKITQESPWGICVFEESWHQGVLGILAARLKDKFNRPVIAFSPVNEIEIKGSARSIEGIHILETIENIVKANPGLISRYGGHRMAAGLNVEKSNFELFSKLFDQEVDRQFSVQNLVKMIYSDGELSQEYLNIDTAELLQNSGPWGAEFAEPTFHGKFVVVKQVLLAGKHLKLYLRLPSGGQNLEAIYFNIGFALHRDTNFTEISIVYRIGVNDYNNKKVLQLIISEILSYE